MKISARRLRVLATAATGLLVALCAPIVIGTGLTAAHATPVTVTGTVSGDHAWDVAAKAPYAATPSVTVDQVDDLSNQVVHVTWQNFTPSINLSGDFFSAGSTAYAVTVLECKGTDPAAPASWTWPDFGSDCYPHTPDDSSAQDGVGNEAYTLTGADGTGETYFHIETKDENNYLGCDATHPCSLVVVPNWGGKQPIGSGPDAHGVNCSQHTADTSFIQGDYAYDTHLGAACSWADRIVVPLSFAPTPDACAANDYAFAAEGAPMLARTLEQWQAGWCQGANGLTFDFDSGTNEYLARGSFLSGSGALTSDTDVAVVNRPVDSTAAKQRQFTYAPLDNSGIAIAYHVDNQHTGALITDLTLNARLVAKLLTQSYSLDFDCSQSADATTQGPNCDPAVKGNPQDIFDDPEFQQLNPQYQRTDFPAVSLLNRGQFMPLVISGDSDMSYQLTRWVDSDPAARAFLAGTADDWNMHVNTYYRDEVLPLDQFQNLDPGYTAPASNGTPGESTMQVSWNPISGMSNVASSLVIDRPSAINPTLPPCGDANTPCVYGRFGSQPPGNRALFAVVGLNDAAADRFPVAKLVNAGGAAVGDTDAGLSAGVQNMTANADGITRSADYTSTDKTQYPLAMTDYAMVPTCGLTAAKASAVQDFLTRVTTSQQVGLQPGRLAPGNLPLTDAQLAQTKQAAAAVSTKACPTSPPGGGQHPGGGQTGGSHSGSGGGDPSGTGPSGNGPSGSGAGTGDNGSGSGGGDTGGNGSGSGTGSNGGGNGPHGSSPKGKTGTPNAQGRPKQLTAFGVKSGDSDADPGLILPIALAVGALLLVGGPGALVLANTTAGAGLLRRLKGVRR